MNEETKKQVRIIMPFGGDDERKKRIAALEFKVIKKMVGKYGKDDDVAITANICQKFAGDINDRVLGEIADADVVVAVLEGNVNVTYELAFRHLLRGQMIVMLLDQTATPKYMDDWAYIQFSEKLIGLVTRQADDLDNYPDLTFSSGELSPGIMRAIDDGKQTYENFEKAMGQVLNQDPKPSHFFEDIVLPLQNKIIVEATNAGVDFGLGDWAQASYYPLSVVKVDWKGISDEAYGKYTLEDIENAPIIYDANWAFLDLYSLKASRSQTARQAINWLNQKKPIDAGSLFDHIGRYTDAAWDKGAFVEDQERLAKNVIFVDEEASSIYRPAIDPTDRYAKAAIVIGDRHPIPDYRGKSFLPCLLARRHSGSFPKGRHSTYLLVAYIDVTDLDVMPKGLKGAPVA